MTDAATQALQVISNLQARIAHLNLMVTQLQNEVWHCRERTERLVQINNDLQHAKLTVGRIIQRGEFDTVLPIIEMFPSDHGVQIYVGE